MAGNTKRYAEIPTIPEHCLSCTKAFGAAQDSGSVRFKTCGDRYHGDCAKGLKMTSVCNICRLNKQNVLRGGGS